MAAQATTAFSNGSFETPIVAPNVFQTFVPGQDMGLWQVESGTVDLVDNSYWQAAEGNQSVDLNGGGPGAVSQTFTTKPGTKYTVTYDLAGNPVVDPTYSPPVKTGKALIDGQTFQDFTFDTTGKTPTNMGYVTRQFTFVANNTSTKLTFAGTNVGSHGPVIDDVRVQSCCSCSSCS
ncbi:choice-of-anchor C family protein [Streptomyces sp. NPDC007264]|uniref:choice-of-anchor C family protein n=1 Tax=Streptomyces sp. NPDC007264 TaxID=3364777 RepID=UPI0036D7C0A3